MLNKMFAQRVVDTTENEGIVATEELSMRRSWPVWAIVGFAVAVGLLLAMLWNPRIADDAIGENVANTILGSTAKTALLNSAVFGIAFAIAAGLATTFTACNCVVFSCIAPLTSEKGQTRSSVGRLLLWMCVGVIAVTTVYGILGAMLGNQMPSLSPATVHILGGVYPLRLLQSTVVFVCLGIVLCIWGSNTLRTQENPFSRLVRRYPWLVPLGLGLIVGCFTVGRPYPLFHKLFQFSASTGNPWLAALLVALQGLGNIAFMALIFVLLTVGTRGRFERWLQAHPSRARMFTALSLIGGGTFLLAYWGLRVPSAFGIVWFPHF